MLECSVGLVRCALVIISMTFALAVLMFGLVAMSMGGEGCVAISKVPMIEVPFRREVEWHPKGAQQNRGGDQPGDRLATDRRHST